MPVAQEVLAMVIAVSVLLVLAALVVLAVACRQIGGARLSVPVKVACAAGAVLLGAGGLVALAAPVPTTPQVEKLSDEETMSLAWMHRNTVEIFIDRPGFGVRRLILPLEDVVKSPTTPPKKDAAEKDPRVGDSILLTETEKPGKKQHYDVQDLLGGGAGNPLLRPGLRAHGRVRHAEKRRAYTAPFWAPTAFRPHRLLSRGVWPPHREVL
jgi:hypothetical protein